MSAAANQPTKALMASPVDDGLARAAELSPTRAVALAERLLDTALRRLPR